MPRRATQKTQPKPPTAAKPAAKVAAGAKPRRRGRPPKHDTPTPNVPGARIIKKYGNRRMYDHTQSRAVTMEDLAAAVRKGEDIRVLDGDTGEDITKRMLVQIILEAQNRQQLELLPIEFLRKLIMLRNEALATWVERYLSAGAQWLERNMGATGTAARAIQESLETFLPWMRSGREGAAPARGDEDGPPPNPEADLRDEIEDLQRRLAELSTRMPRRG